MKRVKENDCLVSAILVNLLVFATVLPVENSFAQGPTSLARDGESQESQQKSETSGSKETPMLEDLLLFFPKKYPAGNWEPDGLKFQDVWIPSSNKVKLHGWYCPVEKPRAIFLYAHGNAGNVADRAPLMSYLQQELKVTTLIFDYRGYGRSTGRASTRGAIDDARAAAKYLCDREKVDSTKIVLMGRSLGGAIVIQLAPELKPRGLVVESTFSSLKDIAVHHYASLAWIVPKKKLDSATAIGNYKGPFFLSHGTKDRIVPIKFGETIFKAANEPKQFVRIPNATHNDPLPTSYYKQLSSFVDELPK